MSTSAAAAVAAPPRGREASIALDALMAALCAWFELGAYLDAWAHVHLPDPESFFTPWHGVLYSGFAAIALASGVVLVRGRAAGRPWRRAMPRGYGATLVGVVLFAAGGVGDMLWHLLFGIEVDVEALLSPTHLVLALGSTLILAGPLRAAWARSDARYASGAGLLPAVASLALLMSSFTFWTLYANPIARPWAAVGNRPRAATFELLAADPAIRGASPPAHFVGQALGVASVLVSAEILAGVVLLATLRWGATLPPGSFTLLFTVNALLMGLARDQLSLAPAIALAGVATDVLYGRLRPSPGRVAMFRAFALAAPVVYFAVYFGALWLVKGLWWSVHLWAGAIVLAGGVGWLTSYLVVPPRETPAVET